MLSCFILRQACCLVRTAPYSLRAMGGIPALREKLSVCCKLSDIPVCTVLCNVTGRCSFREIEEGPGAQVAGTFKLQAQLQSDLEESSNVQVFSCSKCALCIVRTSWQPV